MIKYSNGKKYMTKLYGDGYLFEIPDKLSDDIVEHLAKQYLTNRHFNRSDSIGFVKLIELADDVAFFEAIKEAQVEGVDIKGQCDECSHWNGVDKRCSCGNRRMCWVKGWDFSFLNPEIYPEPY